MYAVNNVGLAYDHPEYVNEVDPEVSIHEYCYCLLSPILLCPQRLHNIIEVNCQSMVQVGTIQFNL